MSWLISFGCGCALFVFTVVGIVFFTYLGAFLRGLLRTQDWPWWVSPVLGILIIILGFTFVIHFGFYGV